MQCNSQIYSNPEKFNIYYLLEYPNIVLMSSKTKTLNSKNSLSGLVLPLVVTITFNVCLRTQGFLEIKDIPECQTKNLLLFLKTNVGNRNFFYK